MPFDFFCGELTKTPRHLPHATVLARENCYDSALRNARPYSVLRNAQQALGRRRSANARIEHDQRARTWTSGAQGASHQSGFDVTGRSRRNRAAEAKPAANTAHVGAGRRGATTFG